MARLSELQSLRQAVLGLHQHLAQGRASESRIEGLRRRCVALLARSGATEHESLIRELIQLTDSASCQLQYHRHLEMHDRAQGRRAA